MMFWSFLCAFLLFEMTSGEFTQQYFTKMPGKSIAVENASIEARSEMECLTRGTEGLFSLAEYNASLKLCRLGDGGVSNLVTTSDVGVTAFLAMNMCSPPDAPMFGSVDVSIDSSSCTFSCNQGYAVNGPTSLQCLEGSWVGTPPTCQEVDECLSTPCMNGGTCTDQFNGYTCACAAGFTGIHCEQDIDDCLGTPCMNGAMCVDQVNGYTCTCAAGYSGTLCEIDIDECASSPCLGDATCVDLINRYWCNTGITDCFDLLLAQSPPSGIYTVGLWQSQTVTDVVCDMATDGGGWTVFQSRDTGLFDFYRNFTEYENGFGDLNLEFWLGLKYVQEMADQGTTELRIDLTAADNSTAYVTFQNFTLLNGNLYTLQNDPGVGPAGDTQGLSYSTGKDFSAYDRDLSSCTCPVDDHGGWWYGCCCHANLNGDYVTPGTVRTNGSSEGGVIYRSFKGTESLQATKMMFRRV